MGHNDRTPAADVAVEMDGGHYETDEEGGDKKYARRGEWGNCWDCHCPVYLTSFHLGPLFQVISHMLMQDRINIVMLDLSMWCLLA